MATRRSRWYKDDVPRPTMRYVRIPRRSTLLFYVFLATIGFFVLQMAVQWLMYVRRGGGQYHFSTGLLGAIFVGGLVYTLLESSHKRRLANRRRYATIAEANHHIRNALDAMQLRLYLMKADPEHTTELLESLDRIKWVLDEVLPDLRR